MILFVSQFLSQLRFKLIGRADGLAVIQEVPYGLDIHVLRVDMLRDRPERLHVVQTDLPPGVDEGAKPPQRAVRVGGSLLWGSSKLLPRRGKGRAETGVLSTKW